MFKNKLSIDTDTSSSLYPYVEKKYLSKLCTSTQKIMWSNNVLALKNVM